VSKRILVLLPVLALSITMLAPIGTAEDGVIIAGDNIPTVVESTTGSYIVVMLEDPLLASFDQEDLDTAAAETLAGELETDHEAVLEDAGITADVKVHDYTVALNGFSAVMSYDEAQRLAGQKQVALILPDELEQPTTDSSPPWLGLTERRGAYNSGITGEDVVVGVIDSGIWPEHPSFADDGSYGPLPIQPLDNSIRSACDFGNRSANPHDASFTCNNKLLGARQMLDTYRALIGADPDEFDSARDDHGHGTHTASTAAGNAEVDASFFNIPLGEISGVAPRARVIAYKGLGNLGGFGSDLAAAIDQAVADGVDVINYSIGGGASLTGADDIAFLFAADAGVLVATSAGNNGPGPDTVGGPGSVPWITTVGANTQKRFFGGEINLDNDQNDANSADDDGDDDNDYRGASITPGTDQLLLVDAELAGGDLCVPETLDPDLVEGKIVLCRRGAIARAAKSLAVIQAGGAGMILYNNSDDDNLFTDSHWVPSVHIDHTPGLVIKDYIATSSKPTAELETGEVTKWKPAPSMTIFSARGPNGIAEDIIKPDITAPGLQILAGASPFPDPGSTPPGELFQAIAGTSMSSPHIAGALALIKQAHPDWTAAMAKSALMTTADPKVVDNDRVTWANPFAIGSGEVDPGHVNQQGSAFQPGLVYNAGFIEYLGFLCDEAPEVFADPAGTCSSLEAAEIPTGAKDLNYPSIGVAAVAGTETVRRTVTSVARGTNTFRANVHAPPGYHVTVAPNRLVLATGDSATFEVTITNTSAPVGEWRFGSLTWEAGGYQVYSPIAVNGSLLAAPAEVGGTGADGSTSFEAKFGYTGSYTAAPHGLEPATLFANTVLQDPDQNFDPSDVGNGANLHKVTTTGAALLRVALPPDAVADPSATDLDVYVYDPTGSQVVASTAGGTDELIDIFLPQDGTWSIYVHGWGVGADGDTADYTLYGWVISATPGGNLGVASAPASATLGNVETIEVSWSGATASKWHLGAVSHTGDIGLLGVTTINVDNR